MSAPRTKEEVAERKAFILAKREAGVSNADIAKELGVDPSTISHFACRHGMPARRFRVGRAEPEESLRDELVRRFHYDPETGLFTRKVGKAAGRVIQPSANGYVYLRLSRILRRAHRLAWLYVHGTLPNGEIDHINRQRSDNRIVNLREGSGFLNMHNQGLRSSNTSGFKGVYRAGNRWTAQINAYGKTYRLGTFASAVEAAAAYDAQAEKVFGELACTNQHLGLRGALAA